MKSVADITDVFGVDLLGQVLSKTFRLLYDQAIRKQMPLPWRVQGRDAKGKILGDLLFGLDSEGNLLPIADHTPADVNTESLFPFTAELTDSDGNQLRIEVAQPELEERVN